MMLDCGNGIRLERGRRCTLSDGVVLVSDHYYPAGPGPWPTLLMRQPYGRDIASTVVYAHPVWFARHGYHVVIQDVRGRGDSEGDFYPFRHEGQDGAETIAWLETHPATNGRLGMYGFSYQGCTQLLAAAENPPGLCCIAPHMAATDLYHGWFYHQGALRLASTLGWGLQMLREDARRRGLYAASERLETAWRNLPAQAGLAPYAEHPAITDPALPTYVRDWIAHRSPGAYWSALDVSTRLDQILVPALHISGWYDLYLEGTIAAYNALRRGAGSAFAQEHQYLLAGPWVHIPWGDRAGDRQLGPAANLNTDEVLLRWFNHWLKDSGEFAGEPRVRHFAMGENDWHTASDWPSEAPATLYLHSQGQANSRRGDGTLSAEKPVDEEPRDVFVYDPEVPVASPSGWDQSAMELGNNLLVYTTAAVTAPIRLLGQPRVMLHAATTAAHADFTAKLVRVMKDGRADFLCMGIARSSWLLAEYAAGELMTWDFTLEPLSVVLAPGERLRLEIASGAFPLYDRNPSTGVAPQDAGPWTWGRSTQQVAHTAEHPSALHLPVQEGVFA
ncbi:MAG: CocE/NonD family hydrolase [Bryobacteraceae bacterium]|nr:CocE/NonD family hydrolase [Bryobacteraceae bacterium]